MQLLEQPEPGIRQQYFWLSLERWFVQKTMMLWIQFKRISSHTSTLPEILVRPCPQHYWPEGRSGWPRHLCPRLLGRNWLICNWFLSQYFILIQSFLDIAYQARHIRESVQQTFSNSGPTWYGRRVSQSFQPSYPAVQAFGGIAGDGLGVTKFSIKATDSLTKPLKQISLTHRLGGAFSKGALQGVLNPMEAIHNGVGVVGACSQLHLNSW